MKNALRVLATIAATASLTLAGTAHAGGTDSDTYGSLFGSADEAAVKLGISTFGAATEFWVGAHVMECDEKRRRIPKFEWRSFDTSDPFEFRDASRLRKENALTYVNDARLRGRGRLFENGEQAWKGSYTANIVVLKNGEEVDACSIDTRWRTPRQFLLGTSNHRAYEGGQQ